MADHHWEAGQKVRVRGLPEREARGFWHGASPDFDGTICKVNDTRTDGLICVSDKNGTHRTVAVERVSGR